MYNQPNYTLNVFQAFWSEQCQLVKRYIQIWRRDAERMHSERSWTIQALDDFGRWSDVDSNDITNALESVGLFCHSWWSYRDSDRLNAEEAIRILVKVRDILNGTNNMRGPRYKLDGKLLRAYCALDHSFIPMDIL